MIKRALLFVGIAILIIIGGIFLLMYFFVGSMCGDTPKGKYQSPDNKHQIEYYKRDCGAMDSGAFNIDLDGTTLLRAYSFSSNPYTVTWADDRHVSIGTATSTNGVRVYKIRDKYGNIEITFDEKIKNGFRVK